MRIIYERSNVPAVLSHQSREQRTYKSVHYHSHAVYTSAA